MYVIVIFIKSDREERLLVISDRCYECCKLMQKMLIDLIFLVDRHFLLI